MKQRNKHPLIVIFSKLLLLTITFTVLSCIAYLSFIHGKNVRPVWQKVGKDSIYSESTLENMHKSVVRIEFDSSGADKCDFRKFYSCGTGVVVYSEPGKSFILTNAHIASPSKKCDALIYTYNKSDPIVGKVVAVSNRTDLGIIEVDKELTSVNLSKKDNDYLDDISIIGSPFCNNWYYEKGYATKFDIIVLGSLANQLSVHTYPGNSGSPVYNSNGNLTGLIFAGSRVMANVGYYIPLKSIERFFKDINFPNIELEDEEIEKSIQIFIQFNITKENNEFINPIHIK